MTKKYQGLKYLSVLTIPATVMISLNTTGALTFITFIYVFGLVPLIELWFKPNDRNVSAAEAAIMQKDALYDWILYLIVPLQWFFVGYFLTRMSTAGDTVTIIGRITALGILCGVFGINVAHELGHRKEKVAQFLAKCLLLSSLYMHFFIEHNRGHHKKVSTSADPASARFGESVYRFWFRSIWYSYLSAWQLENSRLKKHGRSPWSLRNEMIWYQLLQTGLLVVIYAGFGLQVMLMFAGAAVVGILLLETVNYIEHYGLSRTFKANGQFERVQPHHSWNSNHMVGRLMLFELSRHSDHHYKASKKYQVLLHHYDSPQMPTGYPGMMMLALVPPAWFALMHPLIRQVRTAVLP